MNVKIKNMSLKILKIACDRKYIIFNYSIDSYSWIII